MSTADRPNGRADERRRQGGTPDVADEAWTDEDQAPRVEDFGDHIPGSRKEIAGHLAAEELATDPRSTISLSKAWPRPDWLALEAARRNDPDHDYGDPKALAWARALRELLRTRPGRRIEYRAATGRVPKETSPLRLGLDVLAGKTTPEVAFQHLDQVDRNEGVNTRRRAWMYARVGHGIDLSNYRWLVSKNRYVIYSLRSMEVESGPCETREDALDKLIESLSFRLAKRTTTGGRPVKTTRFSIRGVKDKDEAGIYHHAGGRWQLIRNYENTKTAEEALRTGEDELEAWCERWRRIPRERRDENRPRTPEGADGTADPDDFTRRFGLRGVQFGNWVNNQRRRADLVNATQGLADLAGALGWPLRWLSLDGSLALAFGARGQGGNNRVKAHYELAQRCIAISRPAGAGSLAHEWFHALDHFAAQVVEGEPGDFATGGLTRSLETEGLTADAVAFFGALRIYGDDLTRGTLMKRSTMLDRRRSRSKRYWSTCIEMAARAFEAWVKARLEEQEVVNDYLVNFKSPDEWNEEAEPGMQMGYPYPEPGELPEIDGHLTAIAAAGRKLFTHDAA